MPKLSKRFLVPLAAAAVLTVGLGACGSDSDDTTAATSTPATSTPAATAPVALVGRDTKLVLDPATAKVLKTNRVTVTPVGPATAGADGIAFPITGGSVDTMSLAGTIDHSGGLEFSAGGKKLAVTDFVVDTNTKQLVAKAGGADVPLLDLDLAGLKKAAGPNGEIVAGNIAVTLTAAAAKALNTTFGVSLFTAGLPIGTVTVTAAARA